MKRTMLALAIASTSAIAFAGPPTDKPPVGPIDVNVVSPAPLPVTEVPSWVTPDRLFFTGSSGGLVGDVDSRIELSADVVLQALDMQVHVEEGADRGCYVDALIIRQDATEVARLGRVRALEGRDAAMSINLPNVYIDGGQNLELHVIVTGPSNVLCFHEVELRGIKVP